MTAYTQYFNRFLHSINILGDSIVHSDNSSGVSTGKMISKKAERQPVVAEMRPIDKDLQVPLPTGKLDAVAEEIRMQFEDHALAQPPYSPFWFWNNNLADELALEYIREGDAGKAADIWEKAVFSKDKKKLVQTVFIDDLISRSPDWPEDQDESGKLAKNGDEYTISREKKTGSSIPCVPADLNYDGNWTIEVDTNWIEGIDKYSYGIVFGREQSSYYCFVITGNGHFSLVKQTKGDYKEIIAWKKAFAINKRSSNHLLLKKFDDQLGLYINNNYVGSVKSEPFFGNDFGFKVWGNQRVSFRKFKFCNFLEEDVKFEVTKENYSCVKNLSMLYLGLATKNGRFHADEFKKGIELAGLFYTSKQKENYARSIEGEQYFYHPEKTIQFYLTEVVDSVKKYVDKPDGISTSDLIALFSGFPTETRQIFGSIFFSNRIHKIEREIETTKASKRATAANAAEAGKRLVKNTREDILYLRNFLGESSPEYTAMADRLARTIMQCGIDYYSRMFDVDYKMANTNIESYLPEHKYALNIAVAGKTKERLKEILNLYQKKIREAKEISATEKGKRVMA